MFRTLSVFVKYAERHSSHASLPVSFPFGPRAAFVRSNTAFQSPTYARLPAFWNTNGSGFASG